MESVAVADVPDAPLSTIGGAGIIPLGEPLTAQFTLTLLLLKHLEGDGSQFGIRSEDAVSVKGGFVHEHKLDQVGAEVNRGRTVPRLSHAVEHLRNRLLIIFIGGEAVTGTEREPHERDGRWGRDPVGSSESGRGFVFCSCCKHGTDLRFL